MNNKGIVSVILAIALFVSSIVVMAAPFSVSPAPAVSSVTSDTVSGNESEESEVKAPVNLSLPLSEPDIWVEPDSFNVTLHRGDIAEENLTIGNNGTGVLVFNKSDITVFFADDMESGADGWTHGGAQDEWELGAPTHGPPGAHSGSNCWGTDLDSTYNNNANEWLMSQTIDLSGASNVNLSFYRWYRIESGYDNGYVEISTDNGATWTILRTYTGSGTTWTQENIDISAYTGPNVRIRFRLTSDYSVIYAGLYIDDVVISAEPVWLSEYPTSGTLDPDNDTNITVTFNATELGEGMYNATIIIESNDTDESPLNIPVNLTVIPPEHDIAVTNLIAPEEVEIDTTIGVNGTICNLGLNDETGIVVDFIVDGVIEDNTTISITSGNCTNVSFNWTAPSVEGEHNLTIYAEPVTNETIVDNNMMSWNISVIVIADIWVEPKSYNFTVKRGETECENLTIGNNGTGMLIFNITTQARASSAPTISPIPITYEDTRIIIEQEFSKPDINKIEKDKEEYDRVTIPGMPKIVKAGKPVLPVKSLQILLPFGKDVQSIEVTGMKRDLTGTYYVEPGEEPVPIGIPMKEPPKIVPNETIYSSTKPYPGKLYEASVQNLRGYKILVLNLFPVQYTPKPGTITHYKEMKIIVNTKPGVNNLYRGLPKDKERVLQVVDNPEIADTYPLDTKFSPSYDHVIITNSTFATAFQELADWKTRKGVRSHVVTVEYINSAYPGRDLQEKIRNYIKYSYLNDGIEYVLLGGDGDGSPVGGETGPAVVPARGFYAAVGGYVDYNIPADLYYAALDGTWDDDNDGVWGEPGEDDLYAEVFVGRAAVDSLEEVNNFINKTIAYESTPADDQYLKNATMVGEDLEWAVWGGDYKDEIKNGSCNWSYCTVGFPPEYNVSTLYDRDYPGHYWPKSVLIAIMNSGTQAIFNHLGHANVGYVMKMYNADVDALVNDKYFFAYSQGCYDGSFDNRGTGGGYYTYDCIAEHFTLTPHGAFAFIGNSRYGWGDYYTTNGPSQHYDRQFYDAIFNESIGNIGKANQDSKEDNIWQISGTAMRWCYYEINLFGDPETSLVPTAVPWLSVTPDNGTVGVGNDTNVSVCVNATYLEEGTYNASIIIANNDPDENPVTIPVNLTVIPPDHDIAVTNLSMLEEVEVNTTIAINGTVCNLGLNDETNIVVDFIVDGIIEDSTTILSLTSGNCTNVSFNWTAPGVEGEHNLTIYAEPITNETIVWNNMLSQNISVITIADIWVMPEEFNVTLQRGDVTEENLTIGNNGTGVLEFNIIDLPGTFGTLTGGRHTVIRKPIYENAIPLWWSDLPVKRRDTNHLYPPSKLKDAIASRTTNITPASKNVPVHTKKIDEEVGHVDFRVETYTPTTLDEYGIMWLDTDQNPETGATEEWWPGVGLNDIGADYMVEMDVGWNEAYLYEWNADAERFEWIGWLTLIPGEYDFTFSIPLALIEDDGNMDVTLVMGNYTEPLDIAPNTGHGTIEATEPMTTIITDPEEGVDVDIKQVDAGVTTISMSPIIFDLEEGFDIDIKQVDAGLDTDVYFRVETYTPTTLDEYGIMWLDTDQNPGTGATEEWWPGVGLNDIGADYAVIIWPEDEEVELYEWNPWLKDFEWIGWYSLILGEYDLTFSIPLAHIKDDGNMDVTLVMGTYAELLDIAPDVGHGTVGGVDWLSEYPTSGTVDPGNATNITVTINATELEAGTYNATIIIANNDPDKNPVFVPVNLTVINLPHIISFSPTDLAPTQYINTTNTFSVTTDQVMTSNTWFVSPIVATTTGNGTSSLTVTWDSTGVYNVTYVGSNENGDVNITWTVTVIGEGGVATAVRPKVSSVTPTGGTAPLGTVVNLSVVIVNSENFDDVFRVNLTTEDIPPEYKASLDWFNWTFKEVGIPAKGEATIPLQADIPANASGVRAFKVAVESTKWTSKTFDTGIFVIT